MFLNIKKLIWKLIFKIRHKQLSHKYSKQFSSFEKTKNFCNSITKDCYSNTDMNNFNLKMFKSNFENLHYKFQPQFKFLIECVCVYLYQNKTFPKILDLGGGFGDGFLYLRNIFKDIDINYTIIEQNEIVSQSKSIDFKCQKSSSINFYNSLNLAMEKNNYDLLFSSGTLQYLDNPYNVLDKINSANFRMIGFTRNSFCNETKYFSQMKYLKIPSNFPNKILKNSPKNLNGHIVLILPHTTIQEKKLLNHFKNFKISFTNSGIEPGIFKDCYSKDILLIRD